MAGQTPTGGRADAPLVFPLPGQEALADALAQALAADRGELLVRSFPDGESYVRVLSPCSGRDVVLAASLSPPNPLVMPLVFGARGLRELGARRIVLVAPYLAYMRQDTRFQDGEVVTSAVFGDLLSGFVDGLVTVDPHLHRYRSLDQVYRVPSRVVHAAPALARWIAGNVESPLLVGPDSESGQWVSDVARRASAPHVVATKRRLGDREVEVDVPPLDAWHGRQPVVVDDIVSTGRTMVRTVRRLLEAGYPAPVCVGVHAVFAGDAFTALQRSGAAEVVTTNTIHHPSNRIDVLADVAASVTALLADPA